MIRIVNKSSYDAHTKPIFKKLNLLKFHAILFGTTRSVHVLFQQLYLKRYSVSNNQMHGYNSIRPPLR